MFEIINKLNQKFEDLKKENPNNSHILLKGKNNNVLISCPHAVEQTREGKIKSAEPETALLALYLHEKYNVSCIIKLHNLNDDANWDLDCSYKKDVVNHIKNNNVSYFIDLHQMAYRREQNICFGVGENFDNLLNSKSQFDEFKKCFNSIDNLSVNNPFSAKGLGTMSKFVSINAKIPALQIEINSKLISNFYNASEKDVVNVFEAFSKLVEKINLMEHKNENSGCKQC